MYGVTVVYVCTHVSAHCNPLYVYEMVLGLRESWKELALYLGYSGTEVDTIARAGGEDPRRQVEMFLRVWWMPDCGKEKTQSLLNQGLPCSQSIICTYTVIAYI